MLAGFNWRLQNRQRDSVGERTRKEWRRLFKRDNATIVWYKSAVNVSETGGSNQLYFPAKPNRLGCQAVRTSCLEFESESELSLAPGQHLDYRAERLTRNIRQALNCGGILAVE
jgi:hypothetical protein